MLSDPPSSLLAPVLTGLALGAGLIVAIGAQNAFVLRQGLTRRHVGPVITVCAVSDALLIALGVAGVGPLVSGSPRLLAIAGWGGAAFLAAYGLLALRRALKPGRLTPGEAAPASLSGTLAATLAFTWLNPHVYLDTVVLVGSVSGGFAGLARLAFAVGAMLASGLWFSALGFGARLLASPFQNPAAWRVLDAVIAAIMLAIALHSASGAWVSSGITVTRMTQSRQAGPFQADVS